ncbi:MAG TPA: hypothetical protein VN915_01985 [Elusimicrobiota bacterium]|nr:hypothetical protein [Elusimicrobiota bacterium]
MRPPSDPSFDAFHQEYARKYKLLFPYVPELIAIHCGLRPALQLSVGPDAEAARASIADFCARAGLRWSSYESEHGGRIVISREPVEIPESGEAFGALFGYPGCCSRAPRPDRPFDRLAGFWTESPAPFETNLFLRTTPFHLVKHLPCAPDCAATLAAARELLIAIDRVDARLGEIIRALGRAPAFSTDIGGIGVSLRGRRDGGRVRYRERYFDVGLSGLIDSTRFARPGDSALFARIARALAAGDELALVAGRLEIFKDGSPVDAIEKPSRLEWRIVEFR